MSLGAVPFDGGHGHNRVGQYPADNRLGVQIFESQSVTFLASYSLFPNTEFQALIVGRQSLVSTLLLFLPLENLVHFVVVALIDHVDKYRIVHNPVDHAKFPRVFSTKAWKTLHRKRIAGFRIASKVMQGYRYLFELLWLQVEVKFCSISGKINFKDHSSKPRCSSFMLSSVPI